MRLDCRGAKVASLHAIGRAMMCSDHDKQAGPFARDGEQGLTGLLHHHSAGQHAGGRVWHQQETKDGLLLLCELDSTADNASSTANDPGHASSVFLSAAERARSQEFSLPAGYNLFDRTLYCSCAYDS